MIRNIPYTYLIGWVALNKWYYGVRYSKKCHPTDLWVTYFTSSKIVRNFVTIHGNPDVIQIRKKFSSINSAQVWEERVLKKMQVVKNSKWLNGHDSKSFDPVNAPKGQDHWTKKNTNAAIKWHKREGWNFRKQNLIMPSGNDHWTAKNTDAAKKHQCRMNSINNPNYNEDVKQKKSAYLKENNPVHKDGVKEKISKTLTGRKRPRKTCEYCNKDIADSIYTKFHGEKCNDKIISSNL